MAQLEAIRHEIRSISILNPGPLTRRLVDNVDPSSGSNGIFNLLVYFPSLQCLVSNCF